MCSKYEVVVINTEIIGNGLLATSFSGVQSSNCLFFCSGVSNSGETRPEAFKREEELLKSSIIKANNNELCFIYFSSVSAPIVDSKYFNHKISMENIIKNRVQNYLIFRLPQVAGPVLNTTLLPTIVKNIYQNQHFKVFKNATRTIVDVEDIVKLFEIIHNQGIRNKVINVCPGYSFKPEDLVCLISDYLCLPSDYELLDLGSDQNCSLDESVESNIVRNYFDCKGPNYLEEVVHRYTPQIVKLINLSNPLN